MPPHSSPLPIVHMHEFQLEQLLQNGGQQGQPGFLFPCVGVASEPYASKALTQPRAPVARDAGNCERGFQFGCKSVIQMLPVSSPIAKISLSPTGQMLTFPLFGMCDSDSRESCRCTTG